MREDGAAMEGARASKMARVEEESSQKTTEDEAGSSLREEPREGVEGEEDEEDEDEGVREQMKEFFSELDVDLTRQKRNLMTEGLRVGRPQEQSPLSLPSTPPFAGPETQEPPA